MKRILTIITLLCCTNISIHAQGFTNPVLPGFHKCYSVHCRIPFLSHFLYGEHLGQSHLLHIGSFETWLYCNTLAAILQIAGALSAYENTLSEHRKSRILSNLENFAQSFSNGIHFS